MVYVFSLSVFHYVALCCIECIVCVVYLVFVWCVCGVTLVYIWYLYKCYLFGTHGVFVLCVLVVYFGGL